ncbi:hypothetical protein [Pseudoflavonifractor sp. 524-17]|uniref:hypothetical protein n=1 Tax=Pseudoflavonifractor sp. 524-17 TaxID=2304577 RepID=UPI00137AD022|nr:hypothetical protein [Pseudoflavonifractor sp. 524-17]
MKKTIRKVMALVMSLVYVSSMTMALGCAFVDDNEDEDISFYAGDSKTTYEEFVCLTYEGGTYREVNVKLSGSYEVDRTSGIITKASTSSPSVTITQFSVQPDLTTYSISNVKRSRSIASNGQTVTFTATFDIFMTYAPSQSKEFCGSYTISIIGDINGGRAVGYRPDDGTGNRYVYPN